MYACTVYMPHVTRHMSNYSSLENRTCFVLYSSRHCVMTRICNNCNFRVHVQCTSLIQICNVYLCFCIFVFVVVFLCFCICVFVFVYLYLCICICVFVFVYLYLCICICEFVCVYLYVFYLYLYLSVCICICLCVFVFVLCFCICVLVFVFSPKYLIDVRAYFQNCKDDYSQYC